MPLPRLFALGILAWQLAACIPGRVKELNALGQEAYVSRKYQQAIGHFRRSLEIYPEQPAIRQQLDNATANLKDIFVFRIYELVDGPQRPIADYLKAWETSAQLPELKVPRARVLGIRLDLDKRFAAAEGRLRAGTEAHAYYGHLRRMSELVPSDPVDAALAAVGDALVQSHLKARASADSHKRMGLALLHTAAAATFAPRDTGLWSEVGRRRQSLIGALAIPLSLGATSSAGSSHASYLLGRMRSGLPPVFRVVANAKLRLTLQLGLPQSEETRLRDQRSARCQVGTRPVPNPVCPSLRSRAQLAGREYQARLRGFTVAQEKCQQAPPETCTRYLKDAERALAQAKASFNQLASRSGRCPHFLQQPIYRTFFYERFTVRRSARLSGTATLSESGHPTRARPLRAEHRVEDITGGGLACARIPVDPLVLPSADALRQQAVQTVLGQARGDLLALQRRLALQQLAGGDSQEERFDALVRARLVDPAYRLAEAQLRSQLAGIWWSDFGLSARIVR